MMVELLAREASLTVVAAKHNVRPKADTEDVAPPNSDITVTKGKLRIRKPTKIVGPKPSVDRFFLRLAENLEDRAGGTDLVLPPHEIAAHTGMDVSKYKESALSRQILRLMTASSKLCCRNWIKPALPVPVVSLSKSPKA